uniref:Mos1 transposase HTH domain-containing protein n=1 Tax=Myotis myotis TaxID=51298 RepID=A0A7J7TJV5_MYOMY|nr:hypothetical protein mMyoMyo1_009097 [Myotis myotis]
MSTFVPKKEHLGEVLIHYFILKKSAAESYRILWEAYSEHAPSQDTCECCFKCFKSDDFNVKDKECPDQLEKFEDQQLQALLDEDACQTQKQLTERLNIAQQTIFDHLQAMGKILKEGKWVPHQLNERQMKNRKVISKMLPQRHKRKSFFATNCDW